MTTPIKEVAVAPAAKIDFANIPVAPDETATAPTPAEVPLLPPPADEQPAGDKMDTGNIQNPVGEPILAQPAENIKAVETPVEVPLTEPLNETVKGPDMNTGTPAGKTQDQITDQAPAEKVVPKGKDYFELLGVPRDADPQTIKDAWRKLVKDWHPDKNPGDENANEIFLQVQQAYEVLSNPEKRSKYQETLLRTANAINDLMPDKFKEEVVTDGFGAVSEKISSMTPAEQAQITPENFAQMIVPSLAGSLAEKLATSENLDLASRDVIRSLMELTDDVLEGEVLEDDKKKSKMLSLLLMAILALLDIVGNEIRKGITDSREDQFVFQPMIGFLALGEEGFPEAVNNQQNRNAQKASNAGTTPQRVQLTQSNVAQLSSGNDTNRTPLMIEDTATPPVIEITTPQLPAPEREDNINALRTALVLAATRSVGRSASVSVSAPALTS